MKRLSLILIAFTIGVFVLSSCNKDDDPTQAPIINVTPSADTVKVNVGEIVDYQVNWSSVDPLQSAKISYKAGTTQQIILDTTFTSDVTVYNYNIEVEVTHVIPVGTVVELTFFGNTKDNSTLVTKYIKVEAGMATYEAVELQAQADGAITAATHLSFYSTSLNERYTYNEADEDANAANIDLVFTHHSVFRNEDEVSFQSPNSQNLKQMWNELPAFPYEYNTDNKNQTYFKEIGVLSWDNLDYNGIESVVGDIGTDVKVRGMNVGDYIAFETQVGKKGILKITDINIVSNPFNETTITFDVKVQK